MTAAIGYWVRAPTWDAAGAADSTLMTTEYRCAADTQAARGPAGAWRAYGRGSYQNWPPFFMPFWGQPHKRQEGLDQNQKRLDKTVKREEIQYLCGVGGFCSWIF